MKPLIECFAVDAARKGLEPLRMSSGGSEYLWEIVSVEKLQWIEGAQDRFAGEEECLLVFDPNEWNLPARLEVGRIAGCDEAPVGYRCAMKEVKSVFGQPWTQNADFYVLGNDGRLLGMRTHEDTGSNTGMWIPKTEPNQSPEPTSGLRPAVAHL